MIETMISTINLFSAQIINNQSIPNLFSMINRLVKHIYLNVSDLRNIVKNKHKQQIAIFDLILYVNQDLINGFSFFFYFILSMNEIEMLANL